MKMRGIACAALVLGAAACKADTRPGSIEGDAYLVTESGAEVSLADLPLALMYDSARVDTLLATICPRKPGEPQTGADSASQARAWAERARILEPWVLKRGRTDAKAHFRVDALAPGSYRVWADTSYNGTRWTWLAPVTVKPAQGVKLALSNANPDENPFRCKR